MILITLAEDLSEISQMLVSNPGRAGELLGLRIIHFQHGVGNITHYSWINGLVEAQFENGGIEDLGAESWIDGRITTVWMDREQYDRIRLYNQANGRNVKSGLDSKAAQTPLQGNQLIRRLSTKNQAADYLTKMLDPNNCVPLNNKIIQLLFNKFSGLEKLIPDGILNRLIELPIWSAIPEPIQADILLQFLLIGPQNEESERFGRLKPYLRRGLPLAFWNKIPENYKLDETLWPFMPDEVQMRTLFQKIVQGKAADEEMASFVTLLRNNPSSDYLSKIPKEILFHPILFSALPLEMKTSCLLGLLQDGSDATRKKEVLMRMVELLKIPSHRQFLQQAPDSVLMEPEIWCLCPVEQKVPVLVRKIQAQVPGGDARHDFIMELAEILFPAKDIGRWISIMPEAIVVEPEIWKLWPAEEKVPILLKKIETQPFEGGFRRDLINELADLMKLPQTYSLWETIPHHLRTEAEIYSILPPALKVPILLAIIIPLPASEHRDLRIKELVEALAQAANPNLWRDIPEDLIFEPPLLKIAPFSVKLRLFKSAAHAILHDQINSSFDDIQLDDDDLCLSAGWLEPRLRPQPLTADKIRERIKNLALSEADKENNEWSRVLSARAAEIAVKQMYRRLGVKIEDTSILQLKNHDDPRWKNCDLISETDEFDIKNARASRHNPKTYVDYLVPRVKQNRTHLAGKDVLIAGVFSQNLWPEEILSTMRPPRLQNPKIQVLGVTSYAYLASLRSRIDWSMQIELDFRRSPLMKEKFLPSWVFNYPDEAYRMREPAAKKINRIKAPIFALAKMAQLQPLPFVMLLAEQAVGELQMPAWQASFVEAFCKIPREERFSLPYIYLNVLNHFISIATGSDHAMVGYEPVEMKEVIFAVQADQKHPFFVHDPLETVATLIDTLQTLWENELGFLRKFKSFKLIRLNILRGQDIRNDQWKTLIAYCGTANCHYSPLVFGRHETCKRCGKIICPKCKVCEEKCPENDARKVMTPQSESAPVPEEPEFPPFDESLPEFQNEQAEDLFWG